MPSGMPPFTSSSVWLRSGEECPGRTISPAGFPPGQRVSSWRRSLVIRRRTDPSSTRSPTRMIAPPRISGSTEKDRDHLFVELPAERALRSVCRSFSSGLSRQGDAGADPVQLEVEQALVLGGDLAQELLAAALHHAPGGTARTPAARPSSAAARSRAFSALGTRGDISTAWTSGSSRPRRPPRRSGRHSASVCPLRSPRSKSASA